MKLLVPKYFKKIQNASSADHFRLCLRVSSEHLQTLLVFLPNIHTCIIVAYKCTGKVYIRHHYF